MGVGVLLPLPPPSPEGVGVGVPANVSTRTNPIRRGMRCYLPTVFVFDNDVPVRFTRFNIAIKSEIIAAGDAGSIWGYQADKTWSV